MIVITANRFRTQERNRADAVERLVGLIAQAAHAPTPRRPTKPTYASRQRAAGGQEEARRRSRPMRAPPVRLTPFH